MGDGQHVWAAAEWVLMMRNCFVREEDDRLILCPGIPPRWLKRNAKISFGPAPTIFGTIHIHIKPDRGNIVVEWTGKWFDKEPAIEVCIPGLPKVKAPPHAPPPAGRVAGQAGSVVVELERRS